MTPPENFDAAHDVRLDELTIDEWWDVVRLVRPGILRDEYEAMWSDFQAEKATRLRSAAMQ